MEDQALVDRVVDAVLEKVNPRLDALDSETADFKGRLADMYRVEAEISYFKALMSTVQTKLYNAEGRLLLEKGRLAQNEARLCGTPNTLPFGTLDPRPYTKDRPSLKLPCNGNNWCSRR
ncbi:hypothetical protein FIE12Z_2350 [Fusarium flagelliforme]|uniref:Uncharacterized protein n=1 Tax=Fusarium flagelliforme TaxID=2675880 RepID=A0A395N0C2_9HYPO|nr:hypothetical protein FIE12Z_2350 [Fusarium flagelliforme]